ncbi:hypothetical protein ACIPX0_51405 [Streptomyces sp. NPDC090075]|uniref:hypothetical protein n=1 Tax=Streptomyces sp. NPDC090075 TaxID=3365937 RepID=UPI003827EAFA
MSDRPPSDPTTEQHSSLMLATSMLSVGVDRSRVGLLHSAAVRLRELVDVPWRVVGPMANSGLPEGLDITHVLLRTAEEASGLPCSASGLLHRPKPTLPDSGSAMAGGHHRLSELKSVIHHATGSGKTATTALTLVDLLTQRMGRVNRHGHRPTAAEAGGIAEAARALSDLLLVLMQRLLTGCVGFFREVVAVPPTASSPCGLLRLAAPRVPRAPGSPHIPGPSGFALAV